MKSLVVLVNGNAVVWVRYAKGVRMEVGVGIRVTLVLVWNSGLITWMKGKLLFGKDF